MAPVRDFDIRRFLHVAVNRLHQHETDTLIIDELALCQGAARVDLAVVNGALHGYEIKSEADTLERLPGQRAIYSRTLDFVTVVAFENHAKKIHDAVPDWWCIWRAELSEGRISMSEMRPGSENPGLDARAVAELLWREEALAELELHGVAAGIRSKARPVLWDHLANSLPLDELCAAVRARLKLRGQRWRRALVQPVLGGDSFRPSAT
jgi:hypothetical protein